MQENGHAPERATEKLRRAIAEGEFLPGSKLPEVQLAQRLGVSRHTLRSAFHILAGEGLVERHPNRGVFVHSPDEEDIREIYRLRRIVETGAVRAAPFSITALAGLQRIVEAAEQARHRDDIFAMAQANQAFHRALITQAGSVLLDNLMDKVLARMRLLFATMREEPEFHHGFVRRNKELLILLQDDRRQDAEASLLDSLDHAEKQLLKTMISKPA